MMCQLVVVGVFIYSCNHKHHNVEKTVLVANQEIDRFNENYFPYNIESIIRYEGKFLLCEFGNDRVTLLNEDLNRVSVIAKSGEGPNEIMAPTSMAINRDSLYVFSDRDWRFGIYNLTDRRSRKFKPKIERGVFERFAVVQDNIIYSNGIYPVTIVNTKSGLITHKKDFFDLNYLNKIERRNRNTKHILRHKNGLVSVAATEPILEHLDINGHVRNRVILEGIEPLDSRLNYRRKEYELNPENRELTYYLFDDAIVHDNLLYTLIYYHDPKTGEVRNNKILVFKITQNSFHLNREYTLKNSYNGDFYGSICVSKDGDFLIAYEATSSTLNIFDL